MPRRERRNSLKGGKKEVVVKEEKIKVVRGNEKRAKLMKPKKARKMMTNKKSRFNLVKKASRLKSIPQSLAITMSLPGDVQPFLFPSDSKSTAHRFTKLTSWSTSDITLSGPDPSGFEKGDCPVVHLAQLNRPAVIWRQRLLGYAYSFKFFNTYGITGGAEYQQLDGFQRLRNIQVESKVWGGIGLSHQYVIEGETNWNPARADSVASLPNYTHDLFGKERAIGISNISSPPMKFIFSNQHETYIHDITGDIILTTNPAPIAPFPTFQPGLEVAITMTIIGWSGNTEPEFTESQVLRWTPTVSFSGSDIVFKLGTALYTFTNEKASTPFRHLAFKITSVELSFLQNSPHTLVTTNASYNLQWVITMGRQPSDIIAPPTIQGGYHYLDQPNVDLGEYGVVNLLTEAKVTGSSLLFTNTTSGLARGGSATACSFIYPPTSAINSAFLSSQNPVSIDLKNGAYNYLRLSQYHMKYKTHITIAPDARTTIAGRQYDLDGDGVTFKANLIVLTAPFNNAVANSQSFMIKHSLVIQSVTANQLFPVYMTPAYNTHLEEAMKLLEMDDRLLFENPLHLKDIGNWLKGAFNKIIQVRRPIGEVVKHLLPVSAPIVDAANTLLDFGM